MLSAHTNNNAAHTVDDQNKVPDWCFMINNNVTTKQTKHNIPLNEVQPMFHMNKTVNVGDIVHNDNTMCSTIVTGTHGAKSLLAAGVPLKPNNTIESQQGGERPQTALG